MTGPLFFLKIVKLLLLQRSMYFFKKKSLCKAHSKLEMVEEYAYELSALHIEVIKGR